MSPHRPMLKTLFPFLTIGALIACADEPARVIREDIEWSRVWVPGVNQKGKPRILLIGDSITEAYSGEVEKQLTGQGFVARLTTSKSLGDPFFLDEVALVLRNAPFQIIHFNNGMHGEGYTEAAYARDFPKLIAILKAGAPGARLICATTTPKRASHNLEQFDAFNERVKARNQIARSVADSEKLLLNDLFALVERHPEFYRDDGTHFDEKGVQAEASQVTEAIRVALAQQESAKAEAPQSVSPLQAHREHKPYFEPFTWPSAAPRDCPFQPSKDVTGLRFTGVHSDYHFADTWYPSWAANGNLYSPYTDGDVYGVGSNSDGPSATTGQAVLIGDDPLNLMVKSLGVVQADPSPYGGRYPCGSLVYHGVWYYGTYCLAPHGVTRYGSTNYNWPWLGPVVGFRTSTDYGQTWQETAHTPGKPLFNETGMWGHPVKVGSPHFVDFGKELEHSPDGKAYLLAHGALEDDPKPRFGNLSWITGDQVYLLRVTPSPENINDSSKYEFYAGRDSSDRPSWTSDFEQIKPLLEWNNNMGCVTATYDAPLKKYLMCITDGGNTCSRMNTYILESAQLTGPWRLVVYMKDFGEQCYFANFPSKFISADGRSAWLCYSANFASDWNGEKIKSNPPGSHYGLVLQEVNLLGPVDNGAR